MTDEHRKWTYESRTYLLVSDDPNDLDACAKCAFGGNGMEEACEFSSSFCCSIGGGYLKETKEWLENIAKKELEKQGVKFDSDKLQYTLIPPLALKEVARNLTIGLKKYPERNNWKKVENAQERYLDALYRHLEAHRAGELFDPDSSVPDMYHLAAVAVNAMFLLEFMLDDELKNKE